MNHSKIKERNTLILTFRTTDSNSSIDNSDSLS